MSNNGVNKAIIIGNIGKDPEVKYFANGDPVINFSVATSESWNDKKSGEKKTVTEWHNVVVIGRLAETLTKFDMLKKGSKVYVEGKINYDSWEDAQGQTKYMTKIKAFVVQILEAKSGPAVGGSTYGHKGQLPDTIGTVVEDDIPF